MNRPIDLLVVLGCAFLVPFNCIADTRTNLSTIYDQSNNPRIIADSTATGTKFGEFLRASSNMLLYANVPNFRAITNGSSIHSTTFQVSRATLPDTLDRGACSAWLVQYPPVGNSFVAVIDPDELENLISFIEYVKKRSQSVAEQHPKPTPMYEFSTRGGFGMTMCIWTKGRIATDLTFPGKRIGLPEWELDPFEAAAQEAETALKPHQKDTQPTTKH